MTHDWRFDDAGAAHLNSGKRRRILNLWTETDAFHLGHLHMFRTLRDLTEAHDVLFYVGEFRTKLWEQPEFLRREQAYRVFDRIVQLLAPKAKAEIGFRPPEGSGDRLISGQRIYNGLRLRLNVAEGDPGVTGMPGVPDPDATVRPHLERAMGKPWGGQNSPFFPMFAFFVEKFEIDTLVIAKRHDYIGFALSWFAQQFVRRPVQVVVVRNLDALNGEPMSQKDAPLSVFDPEDYLVQVLKTPANASATPAFIRNLVRFFLRDSEEETRFGESWTSIAASYDNRSSDFSKLRSELRPILDEFRNAVYTAVPDTREETHQRITNVYLLGYMPVVFESWETRLKIDNLTPPAFKVAIDRGVDDGAYEAKFLTNYYDSAFAAVRKVLEAHDSAHLSGEVIRRLLTLTDHNRTTDLFLYFGSKKHHRDHYVHTFNVAALGQFLLDLHVPPKGEQLKKLVANELGTSELEVEVAWWLTAMLHDHAYPLYSMMQWMDRLHPIAGAYRQEKELLAGLALPHISHLEKVVHVEIRKHFEKAISDGDFDLNRLWNETRTKRDDLFWFMDDGPRKALTENPPIDHAFAAVLNIVFHLQSFGNPIRSMGLLKGILRGILFHTSHALGEKKPPPVEWRRDPLAYLLLVCDELQEWSRRSMRDDGGKSRLEAAKSELLLSPLKRRFDNDQSWQLATRELDITVRYLRHDDVKKWDSHQFHEKKSEIFRRLVSTGNVPRIRLLYALATDYFPAT